MPEHHHSKSRSEKVASKTQWDKFYEEWGRDASKVDENIPLILDVFRKYGVKRILDLGCGAGRHALFFLKKKFDVYGIDLSSEAIKIARRRLREAGLPVKLMVGSIYGDLPYKDNFFDAVISIRTINHGRIEDIRKAIQEIRRVLVPGGLVFVTSRKRISKKRRLSHKNIALRTYVPTEGKEKGVVHYLFTKEILRKEFEGFRIHDLWIDENDYYCLLGELKK